MKRALARIVSIAAVVALAVTGAVPGAAALPRDDAAVVAHLQDELAAAVAANDIPAIDWTLAELDGTLAGMSDGSREIANPARDGTAAARDQLAGAGIPGVPSLPEALNMLLQKLLATLSELIDNLLGGGLPVPA